MVPEECHVRINGFGTISLPLFILAFYTFLFLGPRHDKVKSLHFSTL